MNEIDKVKKDFEELESRNAKHIKTLLNTINKLDRKFNVMQVNATVLQNQLDCFNDVFKRLDNLYYFSNRLETLVGSLAYLSLQSRATNTITIPKEHLETIEEMRKIVDKGELYDYGTRKEVRRINKRARENNK